MKNKVRVRGQLKTYLQWPLLMTALVVLMNLAAGFVNSIAGLVMSVFTIMYAAIAFWIYIYGRKKLLGGLVEFSSEYAWVQKQLLSEMALPYGLADNEGRLLWMNEKFKEILKTDEKGKNVRKNLQVLFPEITREVLTSREAVTLHTSYGASLYRLDLKPVFLDVEQEQNLGIEEVQEEEEKLIAVYLFDETQIVE